MIVDGQLFQPLMLARPTFENDGSCLPRIATPRPCSGKRSSGANRTEIMNGLKMWPTPVASQYGSNQGGGNGRQGPKRPSLSQMVQMFPTPRASEATRGPGGSKNRKEHQKTLSQKVGGQLNPEFVEWLMGYRIGWTALDAWAIQWFRHRRAQDLRSLRESVEVTHAEDDN
jgi:hypothetical protein